MHIANMEGRNSNEAFRIFREHHIFNELLYCQFTNIGNTKTLCVTFFESF